MRAQRTIVYLLVFVFLQACREDYTLELPDSEPSLSLFAELSPGDPIEVSVLTTQIFGQPASLEVAEDAILLLSGTDMQNNHTGMVYIPEKKKYVLINTGFRPKERSTYEIMAFLPGFTADTLRARTYVPPPVNVREIKVLTNNRFETGESTFNHRIVIGITIGEAIEKPAYFHLIPQRAIAEFRIDQNGNKHITESGLFEVMEIVEIRTARNAVNKWEQKDGLFIDYSRITDELIEIELTSRSPLQSVKEVLDRIQLELRTISPELYAYHQQLHRRIISNQTNYSYPAAAFSNVQNGKGVFGAYSATLSSVKLK